MLDQRSTFDGDVLNSVPRVRTEHSRFPPIAALPCTWISAEDSRTPLAAAIIVIDAHTAKPPAPLPAVAFVHPVVY
jgi:hypothetical protein